MIRDAPVADAAPGPDAEVVVAAAAMVAVPAAAVGAGGLPVRYGCPRCRWARIGCKVGCRKLAEQGRRGYRFSD